MTSHSRRRFLKDSATAAIVVSAGAWLPSGFFPSALAVQKLRPFEMLVLGDSIMWGQGLKDESKFYNLVHDWLKTRLAGRSINKPNVKAHSGAKLWQNVACPQSPHGEVNLTTPTVLAQMANAAKEYAAKPDGTAQVDLVLIDGGINDLGVPKILDITIGQKDLEKNAAVNCARMKCVMETIATTFPNARIVITGYYPIVSNKTPREALPGLMAAAWGGIQHNKISEALQAVLNHKNPISWINNKFFKRWVELSAAWGEVSSRTFREVVDAINHETSASCDSETTSPASASISSLPGGRAFFADVDFQPENCYGAEQTLLWQIKRDANNEQAVFNLVSDDPLFPLRQAMCKTATEPGPCGFNGQSGHSLISCRLAGAGHPNNEGATKYAAAIEKELTPIIGPGGWAVPH